MRNQVSRWINLIFEIFILIDTPGFENENRSKPEETKIISGGGGLAKPETISEKILKDSLVKWLDIDDIVST